MCASCGSGLVGREQQRVELSEARSRMYNLYFGNLTCCHCFDWMQTLLHALHYETPLPAALSSTLKKAPPLQAGGIFGLSLPGKPGVN